MNPARPPATAASIDHTASRWVMRRDAGLTPAEEAELRDWIAAEPRHAEALARKQRAWSALDRPHRHGQADEVVARLGARAGDRQRRRRLGLGAAAALLLGAASWPYLFTGEAPGSPAGRGVVLQPETRRLPDGSVVDLRPGARLDVDFTGDSRRVHLRAGTAFFAVARDPARPFFVRAGDVDFRALGTRFAVERGPMRVDLLVTEGRVAVDAAPAIAPATPPINDPDPAGSPAAARGVALAPLATVASGQSLAVSPTTGAAAPALEPATVSSDEIDARLAWRVPRLEFSELPLTEAIALLNRHNPVPLRLADPSLASLRVSGVIRADNPDGFLRLIASSFEVEGRRTGDTILIHRRGR